MHGWAEFGQGLAEAEVAAGWEALLALEKCFSVERALEGYRKAVGFVADVLEKFENTIPLLKEDWSCEAGYVNLLEPLGQ